MGRPANNLTGLFVMKSIQPKTIRAFTVVRVIIRPGQDNKQRLNVEKAPSMRRLVLFIAAGLIMAMAIGPAAAELLIISCDIEESSHNPWIFTVDLERNTVLGEGGINYTGVKITEFSISFEDIDPHGNDAEAITISRLNGMGRKTLTNTKPRRVTSYAMKCEKPSRKLF